jgi:hypothetical protein
MHLLWVAAALLAVRRLRDDILRLQGAKFLATSSASLIASDVSMVEGSFAESHYSRKSTPFTWRSSWRPQACSSFSSAREQRKVGERDALSSRSMRILGPGLVVLSWLVRKKRIQRIEHARLLELW